MSAFTMVSLFADVFNREYPLSGQVFTQHPWWDNQRGWKNLLNNLRLVIELWIAFHHLKQWLTVFFIPTLEQGFVQLIERMQQFTARLFMIYFYVASYLTLLKRWKRNKLNDHQLDGQAWRAYTNQPE